MAGYLTTEEAQTRLSERYGITATLTTGDVEAASDELDDMTPFIGSRYSDDINIQARPFPRDETLSGDGEGAVPERVLDWVALRAYQLATDEEPPVTSESAGGVSVSYKTPKVSQTDRRMAALLSPYLRQVGRRV